MNDESIFNAALQKSDPAERAAFLNQACAGDAEMRARVEALLGAHAAAGSFLAPRPVADVDTVTLAPRAEPTSPPPFVESPGTRIGPYKLLQQIGEGGMGTVWMAEQMEPVRRNVALKIVKAGLDSAQVIARFEAERQALALMDHPNIARVLDAGSTASGRPFFVMELVKGAPITKYCDDHKLSVRQRLELFIPVCLALQHAHQKGIIHRDIKPSNVLVAPYDGKPVVKVIDFGVAKATGQRLTEKTMFTQFGAVIGTLEYMSPEQAELNNQDIDTRSDIYALGVLLYELLTGTTPLNMERLRGAAFAAILMQIQENEPPRPSTRLSESRETLAMISAQRQTEPARLAKLVRGELDWIVMKALDKDRSRRYDTAGNLARDIEHHLHEEPVDAGPPSATYRLRKLIRRNRGAVAAAVIILLALVGGMTAATWGLLRANRARDAEAEQRHQAEVARNEETQARNAAEAERITATQARNAAEADRVAATRARDDAERTLYFNRVNLAYQYWLGDHLDQSSRILNLCPRALRGWEWRYLDHLHHADLLTLVGNGQFGATVEISKDGNRMATFTSSDDNHVQIWDLKAGKPLAKISRTKSVRNFSCAALSADGNLIAIGDQSGAITFWQTDSGKFVREFAKLKNAPAALSFSPDGRWLAAASARRRNGEMLVPLFEAPRDEELIVWEVAGGKELFHPKGYGFAVKFSPDGSRLMTFRENPALRLTPETPEYSFALFNTSTWNEVVHGRFKLGGFSFSGDGKRLAMGAIDRQNNQHSLHILDSSTGQELSSLTLGAIGQVALNHDGTIAALTEGFPSTRIDLWDLKSGLRIAALRGHTETVHTVEFVSDGRLVSWAADNTIKFWDPNSAQDVRRLTPATGPVYPALLSPGGAVVAQGHFGKVSPILGPDRSVTLVDAQSGQIIQTLAGHEGGTSMLAFNGDGSRLASSGPRGDVKVWNVTTGSLTSTIPGKVEALLAVALSPDGRWVAATHQPKVSTDAARQGVSKEIPVAIELYDAETGNARSILSGHHSRVNPLVFSPDGKLLASVDGQGVKIWDSSAGTLLRELDRSNLSSGIGGPMIFSKSGNLLATVGFQIVQVWDVASGRSLAVFQGHAAGRLSVAISADETRLASAGDREVKLWDIRSGQEILTLPLPQPNSQARPGRVQSLAWSADGQQLRAALSDGSVVEWSATRP